MKITPRRLLVFGVPLVLAGVIGYQYFDLQQNLNQGLAAYQQGDCATALPRLNNVVNSSLFGAKNWIDEAQAPRAACFDFQPAKDAQNAGNYGDALYKYFELVVGKRDATLFPFVKAEVAKIFSEVPAAEWATYDNCGWHNYKNIATYFDEEGMLPEPAKNIPALFYECGQYLLNIESPRDIELFKAAESYIALLDQYPDHPLTLEVVSQLPQVMLDAARGYLENDNPAYKADGMAMLTLLMERFPDHELANEAEAQLAKVIAENATAQGADQMPQPQAIAISGTNAVVTIQNGSPTPIQVAISGPNDSVVDTLPECLACVQFTDSNAATCGAGVPSASYTLSPGTYQVTVSSLGDTIIPFYGSWRLDGGFEYPNCIFVVTTFQ